MAPMEIAQIHEEICPVVRPADWPAWYISTRELVYPVIMAIKPATMAEGFFDVQACNDTNRIDLFVFGNDEQAVLMARLDNLGKGASGAAVQSMNLHLGLPELAGL